MAHVKRPGPGSKAPYPSVYPSPRQTDQDTGQSSERQESEFIKCASKDVPDDQLTVPHRHHTSRVPGPEDMEDTGSEYDNVGSDVEQDYDEVLHLPREGAVDMRYYKQYCPEEAAGYLKHHAGTENINENSGAARAGQDAQVNQPFQPQSQPCKPAQRSIQSVSSVQAGAKCNVGKGLETSYFFSDGDDIEEVLVGVKFIEDMEEQEQNTPQVGEMRECVKSERVVETDRGTRSQRNPELNKKPDNAKEKNSKGRGRRGNGEYLENAAGRQAGAISTDQRPRSKHMRAKARAGSDNNKPHPPPPPRHPPQPPPPATAPKGEEPSRRETVPVPGDQDSAPRVTKPVLALPQSAEVQGEHLEERQRELEATQQVGLDVRRLVVAMSRARLGLYVFARVSLFQNCFELTPVFNQLTARPLELHIRTSEYYNQEQPRDASAQSDRVIKNMPEMATLVYNMYMHMIQTSQKHRQQQQLAQPPKASHNPAEDKKEPQAEPQGREDTPTDTPTDTPMEQDVPAKDTPTDTPTEQDVPVKDTPTEQDVPEQSVSEPDTTQKTATEDMDTSEHTTMPEHPGRDSDSEDSAEEPEQNV